MKIYSKRNGRVQEVTLDVWDQMKENGMSKHWGIERGQKQAKVSTPPTVVKFMEGKASTTDSIDKKPQTSSDTNSRSTLTPKRSHKKTK